MTVALVHDYLTQRGGAERVVLAMTRAFPSAPLHVALYDAASTFPEFASVDVRPLPLDRLRPLRRHHRLALPLLAPAFSRLTVDAEVVLCSSSGWAHGASVAGRKVVYCHTPARWLYQTDRYLRSWPRAVRIGFAPVAVPLRRWDRAAARSAARYLVNSSVVRDRVRKAYGIDAEVLHPPPALRPDGPSETVDGIEPGYVLCVARLLSYKNVDAVLAAFRELPGERLVVVGTGPERALLEASAPANVAFVGSVRDAELRWLYSHSVGLVAASHEDYGLTPLEAAAFGKPSAVLRWGGFLDTIVEGETGVYFEHPTRSDVAAAVRAMLDANWNGLRLREQAEQFGEASFSRRLRAIAAEVSEGKT